MTLLKDKWSWCRILPCRRTIWRVSRHPIGPHQHHVIDFWCIWFAMNSKASLRSVFIYTNFFKLNFKVKMTKSCKDCCYCLICCRVGGKNEAKEKVEDKMCSNLEKNNPECYNKLMCICCCCLCFKKARQRKANQESEDTPEENLECEDNATDVVTEQPKTSYCKKSDEKNIGNIETDPSAVEIEIDQ